MAIDNKKLNQAKAAKKDEFYTQYRDIEEELQYYGHNFENKIVYCNCDNPEWSNFWLYFYNNFHFEFPLYVIYNKDFSII